VDSSTSLVKHIATTTIASCGPSAHTPLHPRFLMSHVVRQIPTKWCSCTVGHESVGQLPCGTLVVLVGFEHTLKPPCGPLNKQISPRCAEDAQLQTYFSVSTSAQPTAQRRARPTRPRAASTPNASPGKFWPAAARPPRLRAALIEKVIRRPRSNRWTSRLHVQLLRRRPATGGQGPPADRDSLQQFRNPPLVAEAIQEQWRAGSASPSAS